MCLLSLQCNILSIQPPIWLKICQIIPYSPLGLLTVAAMLPLEWEKRLVDLNVTNLAEKDLEWADYIFVSAMVVQRESAHAVIQRCKSAGAKIVAGGPLFTMEHERFPDVDYYVLNEAEATLKPFLDDLEQGQAKRVYSSTEYPDIYQTPVPLWRLAKLKYYDSVSIQFSRGCPFSCDFCNVTAMLGHRPRTKTAVQIIAELDSLYALGWRKSIFFVDDNFIGNKKQIKSEVLPALIEWRKGKTGMPFNTEASINLADDPMLLKLMTQAGFDTVFVGIETPNEDSLVECGRTRTKAAIWWKASSGCSAPVCRYRADLSWVLTVILLRSFSSRSISSRKAEL